MVARGKRRGGQAIANHAKPPKPWVKLNPRISPKRGRAIASTACRHLQITQAGTPAPPCYSSTTTVLSGLSNLRAMITSYAET